MRYLEALEEIYAGIKGVTRDLRPTDTLIGDLEVDSLSAIEMLVALEDRFGHPLLGNPAFLNVTSVGDLLDLLEELELVSSQEPR